MPVPYPVLDDRSYDQLLAELRSRIPAFTPEWSDTGPADPGVTLLELVAFLGENLLFRFNQIPEALQVWLARLLDVRQRPAVSGGGLVACSSEPRPGRSFPIGVLRGTVVRAGRIEFETEQDLEVFPVAATAMVKAAAPVPAGESLDLALLALSTRGGLAADEQQAWYVVEALPAEPDPSVLVAGGRGTILDVSTSVDHALWVALRGTPVPGGDPPSSFAEVAGIATARSSHPERLVLSIAVAVPGAPVAWEDARSFPGWTDLSSSSSEGVAVAADTVTAAPAVEWMGSTGELDDAGEPVFRRLPVVGDTTDGLRRRGVVRLSLAGVVDTLADPVPADPMLAGVGAWPPAAPEPEDQAGPVLGWLRAHTPAGAPLIGEIAWVGVNGADVIQGSTTGPELLGTADGQPAQSYTLANLPVDGSSLVVEVDEDGRGWVPWTLVDSFIGSRAGDRHYTLDPHSGDVVFGDSVAGLAPPAGRTVRAARYRFGGGTAGNVPADAITSCDVRDIDVVTNPLPIAGGADPQTITDALSEVPARFRHQDRAVSRDDFVDLAMVTPGAGVGRAEVLPRFDPRTGDTEADGVVTVVVWPTGDPVHPDAPMPDRSLLDAVCRHLHPRRLVTTELYVVPPVYRRISVGVGFEPEPGASVIALARWIELALRRYLAPLAPYGPNGRGWPIGRDVIGPELEAVALQIEGVRYLTGLRIGTIDETGAWVPPADGTTIALEPHEVVEVVEVRVGRGPAPDPTDPGGPPSSSTPVPVPVVPERC